MRLKKIMSYFNGVATKYLQKLFELVFLIFRVQFFLKFIKK